MNRTLVYDIQYVPKDDSFRTTNKVWNKNNFILLNVEEYHFTYRVSQINTLKGTADLILVRFQYY